MVEITFSLIIFENQKRKELNLISKLNDKLTKLNKNQNNDNLFIIDNEKIMQIVKKLPNTKIFKDEKIVHEFNSSDRKNLKNKKN